MKLYSAAIVIAFIFNFKKCNGWGYFFDPDINRNTSELVSMRGYPFEEYETVTTDGYFLTIHRISHGRRKLNSSKCKRQVVLLVHGFLTDSSSWLLNSPEQSLGFILADNGYDVWLANLRGNLFSSRHAKLSLHSKEFWNFSFDENGEYDLPATIDFVLSKTKQKQLIVIGLSQGTTAMFVLLSQRPEYNKKVKLFVALAPVVTLENSKSMMLKLAPFVKMWTLLWNLMGTYKLPPNELIRWAIEKGLCNFELKPLCKQIFFEFSGYDIKHLNETRLSVYISHIMSGSSMNSLLHFVQMIQSKQFRKFDYGKIENRRRYNQATPPEYDISRVTAPVMSMWSSGDRISDPRDVQKLMETLPNLVSNYSVPYNDFGHFDFAVAVDAYKHVYKEILDFICKLT